MFLNSERRVVLFFACLIALAVSAISYGKGLQVIPPGPTVPVTETTRAIWENQTLQAPYFLKMAREGADRSRGSQDEMWQDIFAVDQFGRFVPKHSIFSAVAAVPFYAVMGDFGFWFLQQLFFVGLLYATWSIVYSLTGKNLAIATLIATCLLSPSLFYTYVYTYDLHCTALIIIGLALQRRWPALGSFVMGLSVFVRPSSVLMAAPLTIAWLGRSTSRTFLPRSWFGFGTSFAGFLAMNFFLWGDPWQTAYSNLPMFVDGQMRWSVIPMGFSLSTLLSDWPSKIYGQAGLLPYTPALLGLPIVLWAAARGKLEFFQIVTLGVGIGYALYIFSYPSWVASTWGNRFLLPPIYLYLLSLIPLMARFFADSGASERPIKLRG